MKSIFCAGLFLIISVSCSNPKKNFSKKEYYDSQQLQFTFLVFEKAQVDSFLVRYESLNIRNPKIRDGIRRLSQIQFDENGHNNDYSFTKNSTNPDTLHYNLANQELKETLDSNNVGEYFHSSLVSMFFYECLPEEFRSKWSQKFLGDFRFNATFFGILRDKSEILDSIIYGEVIYQDDKLLTIFKDHIFNEITSEQAKSIKNLILTDESFQDPRFKTDKDNFVFFLDKTINNEWRLFLTDWN